jgi:cellobiose phosphorylase
MSSPAATPETPSKRPCWRCNATWARVYYNGYRALCQDLAGMASIDPEWAWGRFRTVLAHQYASGFAPRAWIRPELVEQGYSDSPVWIATTVRSLVGALGRPELLNEAVPFVDRSGSGSVFEHLKRSLDHLWSDRGRHGLSRIHRGDWNDLMNAAGWNGEGESVWLTLALVVALEDGAAVAGLRKESRYRDEWSRRADELRRLVRAHAFVDGFFLRAFTHAGEPLGAPDSGEGVFLIPQAWAVLAGVVAGEEAGELLARTEERLERPQGLLTVERGFSGEFRPDIGLLSTVRPGCNVNAGFFGATFRNGRRTVNPVLPEGWEGASIK